MTISDINIASPAAASRWSPEKTLDTAAHEFEGLLLGNILKQGIVPQPDEDENEQGSSSNSMFTEFAAEQTARVLSNTDATGIAEQIKRQMQMRTPGA